VRYIENSMKNSKGLFLHQVDFYSLLSDVCIMLIYLLIRKGNYDIEVTERDRPYPSIVPFARD